MIFDLYCLITHNLLLENDFYDYYFTNHGIAESTLEATVNFIASKFVQIDKSNDFEKHIWDEVKDLNFNNEPIKKQVEKIRNYLKN